MPFDFAEIFTAGVRELLPRLQARKLAFAFDCRGPQLTLPGDPQALRCGLHRLQDALIRLVEVGFLFFDAETGAAPSGEGRVLVRLAGTGLRVPAATMTAVLDGLGLPQTPVLATDPPGTRRAAGLCPRTGLPIEFLSLPKEGVIFSIEALLPGAERWETSRRPDAQGEPAWVINPDAVGARSMARRLQRFGWTPALFDTPAQALLALAAGEAPAPGLLIAVESDALDAGDLEALDRRLPPDTQRLHAVAAGSPALAAAPRTGFGVAFHPLSPWDLHELTLRHAEARGERPAGPVLPQPVLPQERPRLLVVDDHPLTRLIARGLAESLGYEVDTASDGEEALSICAAWSPDVVLMDVHMAPLDGPGVTRRLRRLQARGAVAPCAVLAATADDSEATRRACREAGMDGLLAKPLLLPALAAELQRVCAGHGRLTGERPPALRGEAGPAPARAADAQAGAMRAA